MHIETVLTSKPTFKCKALGTQADSHLYIVQETLSVSLVWLVVRWLYGNVAYVSLEWVTLNFNLPACILTGIAV